MLLLWLLLQAWDTQGLFPSSVEWSVLPWRVRVHHHLLGVESDQHNSIHYFWQSGLDLPAMQNVSSRGASRNKQEAAAARQQGSIPSEKLAKFAKLLTCSPARGAGRAGQGSLQSLFWFPGRNKARSNVLWRARTSTGPLVPSTACQSTLSWLSPASSLQAAVQLLSRLSGAGGGGPADQGVAAQLLICHSPWVPARTPHCVR